YCARGSAWFAY
nr:immunoglobulin heavy chain junction region [Mus musculus]